MSAVTTFALEQGEQAYQLPLSIHAKSTYTIDLTPYLFISAHKAESLQNSNISIAHEYTLICQPT
jgi:hypothetical protein